MTNEIPGFVDNVNELHPDLYLGHVFADERVDHKVCVNCGMSDRYAVGFGAACDSVSSGKVTAEK